MNGRRKALAALFGLAIMLPVCVTVASAQEQSVGGQWTCSVEGMSMSLMLTQRGTSVAGTLESPHGPIQVTGEFEGGKLTFTGALAGGPHELKIAASGTLQPDGTLAGSLATSVGDMSWTAARDQARDAAR
jgi:hypothetical protein